MTTFICCGCAYGCVPTKLRPLIVGLAVVGPDVGVAVVGLVVVRPDVRLAVVRVIVVGLDVGLDVGLAVVGEL